MNMFPTQRQKSTHFPIQQSQNSPKTPHYGWRHWMFSGQRLAGVAHSFLILHRRFCDTNRILIYWSGRRNGIIQKEFRIALRWDLGMLLWDEPLEELRIVEIGDNSRCRRRSWPQNFIQISEIKIRRGSCCDAAIGDDLIGSMACTDCASAC